MMSEVKEVELERRDGRRRWFLEGEVARREAAYLAPVVVDGQPHVQGVVVEPMGRKEVVQQSGA